MLIFLYGEDTYRLSKKLALIVEEYQKRKTGLDFLVIDAVSGEAGQFFSALSQCSLFQEKKFIVLKNPITNKDFKEALLEKMEGVARSGHNIVFCQEGKVLKNDRLLTAFKKNAQVVEFTPLSGEKLIAWTIGEFGAIGNRIGRPAAEILVQRIGNDLWCLENEIQKIGHYLSGREVSAADIESLAGLETETNIFRTIDAIAQRDKKLALALIKDHISKGDHPLYLLAMMASQFRNLVLVKSCVASDRPTDRLGIHPYVLGKTTALARRFEIGELKNIYRLIGQFDLDIKLGKVDPETGIDLLVSKM